MHLSVFSWALWAYLSFAHPFYISLTELRYNPTSKKMEVAQKIFWDDLEVALSKKAGSKVDFLNPKDKAKLETQVKPYLLGHTQVWVNGKLVPLTYVGYEVEEDAAWFYLESTATPIPKTVEVQNTLLIQEFDGQQNIVHVYVNSKSPKSLMLREGKERGKVSF
ncbi:MAG: hypothetical protein O2829_04840 [Bacteroidetes bacterium]|nr:hypothetical protein [Bacteroidota bacterium]MDA1268401.1 hypothetical protein [Bacteroidota bacterium]